MLEGCLSQQDRFFEALREAKCPLLLTGLNKLFLDSSGQSEHMLNLVKYVTYNSWLPKQALLADRIVSRVKCQPSHKVSAIESSNEIELTSESSNSLSNEIVGQNEKKMNMVSFWMANYIQDDVIFFIRLFDRLFIVYLIVYSDS